MPAIGCPSCGHVFTPTALTADSATPDPSVVQWFGSDADWLGELSTDEVYGNYLRATGSSPVSRDRFVADLAYLGVETFTDDDTQMLVRP